MPYPIEYVEVAGQEIRNKNDYVLNEAGDAFELEVMRILIEDPRTTPEELAKIVGQSASQFGFTFMRNVALIAGMTRVLAIKLVRELFDLNLYHADRYVKACVAVNKTYAVHYDRHDYSK